MKMMVPPGGFAGFSQMTPASQRALGARSGNGNGTRRRKRKASTRKGSAKRKRTTAKRKAGRLVKGSAAAKRYMASIRRKRRK